jgi:hypothetical protein
MLLSMSPSTMAKSNQSNSMFLKAHVFLNVSYWVINTMRCPTSPRVFAPFAPLAMCWQQYLPSSVTFGFEPCHRELLYRELMHLGMIIESHATHICALALPDFLKTPDILDFATKHPVEFDTWTQLRKLGAAIQTTIGGRPFHPVNLHVGRLSSYPGSDKLTPILTSLNNHREMAINLANVVLSLKPPMDKTTETSYLALVPRGDHYGYFGSEVKSTDGWHCSINEYKEYLSEVVVPYSHAKKSSSRGQTFMVGAMARLALFGDRLGEDARAIYQKSPLAAGSKNTVLNNLAQAIELVEAIQRAIRITETLINLDNADKMVEDVTGEHSDFCHQPPFAARAGESAVQWNVPEAHSITIIKSTIKAQLHQPIWSHHQPKTQLVSKLISEWW